MPTVNAQYMTLADYAPAEGRNGAILPIVEMLSQVNPIIDHAPSIACNLGLEHKSVVRTGLPTGTWTALYEGIDQEKALQREVTDRCARLEGLATVDTRLLRLAKDAAQVRLNQAAAFLEGMSQTATTALLYSDLSNPRKFLGLMPRFSSTSAENGNQVVLGGGSGSDNCSVLMITWGERTCHLIHPETIPETGKSTTGEIANAAGIMRENMGRQRVLDSDGKPYYVEEDHFEIHLGLCVKDWRGIVRAPNIDVSNLAAGTVDCIGILRSMFYRSKFRAPAGGGGNMIGGRTCIYAPREFIEAYDEDIADKSNVQLTIEQAGGSYAAASAFRGIPIYELDSLITAEALVS